MNDKEKVIYALKLFNEKAEELLLSTFAEKMLGRETGFSLHWSWETEREITEFGRTDPNKENIKAFVLDYRFFIQDNEKSSFRNLKEIYSSNLLSAKFESRFDSARNALNNYLDTHGKFQFDYNGEILTRRKIIDTFIYGGLSHANEAKEKLFKEWQRIPPFFPMIENEFVYSLAKILDVVVFIKNLNSEAIEELEK